MKQSETIENLAEALVSFQARISVLPKTASGYGYKYTPLDVIVDAIRQPMADNGLSYVQFPTIADGVGLTTRLMHKSGQWLEETAVLPLPTVGKSNEAQAYGAGLTYLRRYALSAMLGLATDEDVGAATPPPKQKTAAPPKPKDNGVTDSQFKPTPDMLTALHAAGSAFYGKEWETKRAELVSHVTHGRTDSTKQLTRGECETLLSGINRKAQEE